MRFPYIHGRNIANLQKEQAMCGVFGIFGHPQAAALVALGLHALQHRGQEAAGITSFDEQQFHSERHLGLVGDNFTKPEVMERLPGWAAIGHNRYSTTGGSVARNVQPLFAELAIGGFAIAHNGNLTNADALRRQLQRPGAIFSSTSDTEVIVHLVATSEKSSLTDRLVDALSQVKGAYSLVILSNGMIIGCRDPLGVRPLVLGDLDGSYVFASETCALDIIGARFVRVVEPGELVIVTNSKIKSCHPFQTRRARPCIFEEVYFARPDSIANGVSVYEVRKRIGVELAHEASVEADVVVPVPDSGTPSAMGFADASDLPFELGIIRNHYVGRTFIEPTDGIRSLGVRLKHNANPAVLKGKRVVLVDDSIVRGTTSQKIVQMVRHAGAREVHMRVASPPTTNPCFYGIDTPEKKKLVASRMSVEDLADLLKVDSLAFLSIDGLYRAVHGKERSARCPQACDACFTGKYPVRPPRSALL